jgi:RNA polymerase sigma-70 factor (ECF subfamily)
VQELDTVELLRKWHQGDRKALDRLVERDLPWIEARVRYRLGPHLRAKAETADFVQDTLAEVLAYAPRFVLASRAQFRALVARILENVLRDQNDRFRACRRALHRERPLPPDTQLALDAPRDPVTRPSEAAQEREWEGWVRLALELLDPPDRDLIILKQWDALSFVEIGNALGVSEDAARMRYHRALARLAGEIQALRSGKLSGRSGPEANGDNHG